MISKKDGPQYIATIICNLTTLVYGISVGWPSVNLPRLQSPVDSPLANQTTLTIEEASWVGSLLCVGGIIGTLFYGWSVDNFGRKNSIMLIAVPQAVSWSIIEFGSTATHLYWARTLAGVAGGGCFVVIPIYVSEISSDSIRGMLGSIIAVVCNLGILLGYIITSYMDYFTVPYLVLSVLVVFFIGFTRAPESPKFLMMRNKMDDAELSLKHLRGFKDANQKLTKEFLEEIQTLRNSIKGNAETKDQQWTFKDLTSRSALRGIFIGVSIMFFSVTTGAFVISNYTASIFKDAGSSVNPEMSSIIVGFILLLGSYVATMLIDRMGRKVLLITSGVGCSISLSVLATYFYLQHHSFDVTQFAWLPLVSLSALMFLGSIGLLTLPFVLLTEVLAQKIRAVVSTCCLVQLWAIGFIGVKFFPHMLTLIGMYGCMMFFAVSTMIAVLFVIFCVPETKGKSIEAIVERLGAK